MLEKAKKIFKTISKAKKENKVLTKKERMAQSKGFAK